MGHGPRRDEKRHYQHQRVQVVTEDPHETHAPDTGQNHAQQRQQNAVQAARVEHQDTQDNQYGIEEDKQDIPAVGIHPAHQHRVAGGMDVHAGRGLLGPDRLDFLEHLAVIELALIQRALDQGRLHIRRDQQAVYVGACQHVALDFRQLFFRVFIVVRIVIVLRAYRPVRRQEDLPGVAVGQAAHQVMVDVGDAVQFLGNAVNPVQ